MKTIAIVIGISEYQDPCFTPLPGACADANRFAAALMSWGLPKENICFIADNKATKANIVKTFYDCRPALTWMPSSFSTLQAIRITRNYLMRYLGVVFEVRP